jgi:hypothetical protein
MRSFVSTNEETDMNSNAFNEMSQQAENFEGFEVERAVLLYGVCDRGRLDFSPLVLKLFRHRKLTEQEVIFLNCARWIKVAGAKLTDSAEREHKRIHHVIVGKPDGGGGPPGSVDPDAGPDEFGMSIADLIRSVQTDDDEEKAKSPPARLAQEPAPVPLGPAAKPEKKTKPVARPIRKVGGPEID